MNETDERYWIYENWRAGEHKALIHLGSCGHCKHGSGGRGGTDSSNGRWIGPFHSLDEAKSYLASMPAEVTERREAACCLVRR